MSAPGIPNLNTLRRDGGRRGGRGRGAASSGPENSADTSPIAKDKIVQSTDNDAATSRLSAVEAGYLDDPFTKMLTKGQNVDRRLPLMNRGTYVRTTAIDRLVDAFLGSGQQGPRQIISLGAGSDTRYFRLKRKYPDITLIYHEFDFHVNTAAKIRQMKTPVLAQSLQNLCSIDVLSDSTTSSDTNIGTGNLLLRAHNSTYHLHALDLRDITRRGRHRHQVEQDFNQMGVPLNIPTLILSECCLIYLPPEDADSVLPYFAEAFQPLTSIGVIIYEPIRPHDAFGRTMVSNLTARGIHLQTLNAHDSLATQKERLRKHGLGSTEGREAQGAAAGGAEAADIDFIWQAWIKESEKERVENLEWMDEVEEWRLLARHYCVAWGWKEGSDQVKDSVFDTWTRLPVQDEG